MYQIFEADHPDSQLLDGTLAAVWHLATLELAVRVEGAERTYLVMQQASYPLIGSPGEALDVGYWCLPNFAIPVPMKFSPPTTVGSLKRLIESTCNNYDLEAEVQQMAYTLGLRDVELTRIPGFIEIKSSPRTPSVVKAFSIERFLVTSIDRSCLRNIADPEAMHGFVFLPLDDVEDSPELFSQLHGRSHRSPWGKPIMTNIQRLVDDPRERTRISDSSISVPSSAFHYDEQGILAVGDLAGYGKVLKYTRENMHTFNLTVNEIETHFRGSVLLAFERMARRAGTTQIQTAGDGFLAGFPSRTLRPWQNALADLLHEWENVLSSVSALNGAIREPDLRVGSRLAIVSGQYSFGRIAGPESARPAFDGASVVDVARIEQGLALATKKGLPEEFLDQWFLAPDGSRHYLAVHADLDVDDTFSKVLDGFGGDSWKLVRKSRSSKLEYSASRSGRNRCSKTNLTS
ncbi:hypothetical protein [Ornithinimicrobium sp. INDO-MA30-4]|uniref:hypothetical protein n=1 Tax=Ornithinimicrobium sp. INDO-MA30-4 TaxID=2908651 RepID=UPI001F2A9817|nr:hypothetical protein [Ornithinimicrobium sp. INDO-MA30-4]UJH70445.1 hypothetical protein L0A91_15255 [Ornithinimicrobium sp. INDO-MA30-4]